jgi:hypothetical protein
MHLMRNWVRFYYSVLFLSSYCCIYQNKAQLLHLNSTPLTPCSTDCYIISHCKWNIESIVILRILMLCLIVYE